MKTNILTKALCLMLAFFTLLISLNITYADDVLVEEAAGTEMTESVGLLTELGVVDSPELNAKATRGDFAVMVGKLLGVNYSGGVAYRYFADVDTNSREASYIHALYEMGIVKGTGENTFGKDEWITKEAAQIIMLRVAGYGAITENDSEYTNYIGRYNLSKGVKNDELTVNDAIAVIFNGLNMPICSVEAYGENPKYKILDDYLLLEKLFKIYKINGVIRGADGISIDASVDLSGDKVLVDRKIYEASGEMSQKMFYDIGKKVKTYIKKSDDFDCVVYYSDLSSDDEIKFRIEDIVGKVDKSLNIRYNSKNTTKSVKLPLNAVVIKNGMFVSEDLYKAFDCSQGFVTINKTEYETIVKIDVYDSVFVSGVNHNDKMIYAKKGVSIDANPDKYKRVRVTLANGEAGSISDIKKGMLITVYRSLDMLDIYTSGAAVSGILEQVNEDSVKIEGTEYELEEEYKSEFKSLFNAGDYADFYLNAYSEVAYAVGGKQSEQKYGFLVNAIQNGGFSDNISVKIFTADGEMRVFYNNPKSQIKINSQKFSAADAITKLKDANNGIISQIVLYKVDRDGYINEIETAGAAGGSLKQTGDFANRKWYATGRIMQPDIALKASGVIFNVPTISTCTTADEKKFKILKDVDASKSYRSAGYTTDSTGFFTDALLIESEKMVGSIGWAAYPMLVDYVFESADEDGEIVKNISLAGATGDSAAQKGVRNYKISEDFVVLEGFPYGVDYPNRKCVSVDEVSEGDIVFCAYDQDGAITQILMYYDYDNPEYNISMIDKYKESPGTDGRFVAGYAVDKAESLVAMSTVSPNGQVDEFVHFHGADFVGIFVYDKTLNENRVYEGTYDDVLTYDEAGENASVVIPFTFTGWAREYIVYKYGI